ncbi:zf-TFIIB domain-containing protein [Acetivibrio thermocellus]|nr:zf-TFIIB domain-containing protein [Acetivibrio thermocellus]
MKCPVCKNIFLEKTSLLDELYAYSCKSCGGNWMRYEDYWKWHESNPNPANKPLDIKTHLPVNDIIQAKICPD